MPHRRSASGAANQNARTRRHRIAHLQNLVYAFRQSHSSLRLQRNLAEEARDRVASVAEAQAAAAAQRVAESLSATASLSTELIALRDANHRLEQDHASAMAQLSEIDTMSANLAALRSENHRLEQELDHPHTHNVALEDRNQRLLDENNALAQEGASIRNQLRRLTNDHADLHALHRNQRDHLEDAGRHNAQLEAELISLREENAFYRDLLAQES